MQKSLAPFLLRSRFGSDGTGRGPRCNLQGRGQRRDTGGVARGVNLSEPHTDHSGQAIRAAGSGDSNPTTALLNTYGSEHDWTRIR